MIDNDNKSLANLRNKYGTYKCSSCGEEFDKFRMRGDIKYELGKKTHIRTSLPIMVDGKRISIHDICYTCETIIIDSIMAIIDSHTAGNWR